MFTQGPVCDFCEIAVDEDEELQPIFVGEHPKPKTIRLNEIKEKTDRYMLLGKPIATYKAMYDALRQCTNIDVKLSEAVYEPEPISVDDTPINTSKDFGDEVNYDKVGAEVLIKPEAINEEPDAEVCDTCAEMFRSM